MGQSTGETLMGSVPLLYRVTSLNVNQTNTDVGSFTGLPSRYIVGALWFDNASATPTLSTISLRTAAGGAGSAIVNLQALSTLTGSTVLLSAVLAITNAIQTASSLVLRSVVAAGQAATVDATLLIYPLV